MPRLLQHMVHCGDTMQSKNDLSSDIVTCPPAPVPGEQFAVINTHPHKERVVREHLSRQGYAGYYPQLLQKVSHARKVSHVLRPMFPGYLFVSLDPALQRWSPIASTVGVRRIVTFGDRPALIDASFVAALQAREINGSIVLPASPYHVGDHVRMAGNAFDGVVAEIVQMKDQERVVVLLQLLQRTVKLTTDVRFVRPLNL